MNEFVYQGSAARIVFGQGAISRVPEEIERLGCTRALILSTPNQRADAEALASRLGRLAVGICSDATMHTPVGVTQEAFRQAQEQGADCTVALGGGSTIGLGKAIASRAGLKQVAIPTTYAGSEVTPILGETIEGRKTTRRSPEIQPNVVIYDVNLTMSLPVALSVTSGLNAMAHAVEALYARDANPIVSLMAERGIAALAGGLPAIQASPSDLAARTETLYGAWLAGTCLGSVGMALHHKICHVLGGTFDLPHAESHAIVLPHVVRFNSVATPEAMKHLASALQTEDPVGSMFRLAKQLGAPQALSDLGMRLSDIDTVVENVMQAPYWNPRAVERNPLRELLLDAYRGTHSSGT